MEWPPHSPGLNNIEHLWCVLVRQVRNRYPPPSCLKELEQVLMEEWLETPLDEVRKMHDSIPRRIEAAQKAGGGPTPNEIDFNECSNYLVQPLYIYIYIYIIYALQHH